MWRDRLWRFFEEAVFELPSEAADGGSLFNPYRDADLRFDLPQAAQIRRANLRLFLESLPASPPILMIGEAPGWRGCRFSGIPFTDEIQLHSGLLPFRGQCSSRFDRSHSETSARIFWDVLLPHHPGFMIWNCVPVHPHLPTNPLCNRPPHTTELRRFFPLLIELKEILNPARLVAIGKTAERVLTTLGWKPIAVRHPAHGGAPAFRAGVSAIFSSWLKSANCGESTSSVQDGYNALVRE